MQCHPTDKPVMYEFNKNIDIGEIEEAVKRLKNNKARLSPKCCEVTRNLKRCISQVYLQEVLLSGSKTSKNSMSLSRSVEPGQSVRGSSTNFPFWPGGLDEPDIHSLTHITDEDVINFDQMGK